MSEKENITKVQVVRTSRNPRFRSVSECFAGLVTGEPEKGFPESITDSSRYESVQSIEARCMRGEIMLQKNPFWEFDGDVTETDLDGQPEDELDWSDPTAIDDLAEIALGRLSDLSTGNKPVSGQTQKASDPASLPVDKSGKTASDVQQ